MLFGTFLRQRNLINDEQLLQALGRQQESMPSLITVLLEQKKITPEILVSLVQASASLQKDLISLIRDRRALSEGDLAEIIQIQSGRRTPLGLILVDMKLMNLDSMQAILSEFLKLKKSGALKADAQQAVASVADVVSPKAEAEQQTEKIEIPNLDMQELDSSMISEYIEVFDSVKKEVLDKSVMQWGKAPLDKEALRELYREMHTLKGTSRFLKAYFTEFIIHQLENLLSEVTRSSDLVKDDLKSNLEDLFLKGFDLVWDLRNVIIDQQTEANFFAEQGTQNQIRYILDKVHSLSEQVQGLEVEIDMDAFKDQF